MDGLSKATFAAGCFWGVENYFRKEFKDSIKSMQVGYTGGAVPEPSYEQVCSGRTGHAEAVEMVFDPKQVGYGQLVEYLFRIHDPTTKDRQGNDRGTQYRSAIFYHDDEQRQVAEATKQKVQPRFKSPIVTEIVPAGKFWSAEEYHQKYLIKNPGGYCNHRMQW
ncbi:hypothetical protein WJX72_003262 [[Myrmecia] bisecta]|uniref:peptide-methionine (S)-S-oxide reductase n=1 Tax=[Myrmecia] bisecta TaxID=41462 RepID=A0AAW1PCX2_9CHLO